MHRRDRRRFTERLYIGTVHKKVKKKNKGQKKKNNIGR